MSPWTEPKLIMLVTIGIAVGAIPIANWGRHPWRQVLVVGGIGLAFGLMSGFLVAYSDVLEGRRRLDSLATELAQLFARPPNTRWFEVTAITTFGMWLYWGVFECYAASLSEAKQRDEHMRTKEHDLNQAAFRRMEESIKQTYPKGQFVAIAGGQIVGDAADFMSLYGALEKAGFNPPEVMIVQAGHEYPEYVQIFFPWI